MKIKDSLLTEEQQKAIIVLDGIKKVLKEILDEIKKTKDYNELTQQEIMLAIDKNIAVKLRYGLYLNITSLMEYL